MAILPEGRWLKTDDSEREIPLVGVALAAMRLRPEGFPQYRDKSSTLSATLNIRWSIQDIRRIVSKLAQRRIQPTSVIASAYRLLRGLSQTELARILQVTFQQVQKCEHARTRISASSLFLLSKVFAVPLDGFFRGSKVTNSR